MATKHKKRKSRSSSKANATAASRSKRALTMEAETAKKWALLISTAVMTPQLRERFLANPQAVAAEYGIGVVRADERRIPLIQEALKRFGSNPQLAREDVSNWTVGLMHHTQNTRCVPMPGL